MIRTVLDFASPAGRRGRLSVLMFHRVLAVEDPLFPEEFDAARFDEVCGWLKELFNVLPLDEAVARLKAGTLPARAVAITFDDGYADNREIALPILQRHGLSATFFIATGFLDGGRMWNDTVIESVRLCKLSALDLSGWPGLPATPLPLGDAASRRAAIDRILAAIKYLPPPERQALTVRLAERCAVQPPDNLMMSSAQVRELRDAGMRIGAHTVSHPILARLSADEARREIAASRDFLEALLGERVGLFAYPNGRPGTDYLPEQARLVRDLGFDAAVSTAWGAAGADADCYQIPRFTPWDRTRLRFAVRMARNLATRGQA